MVHFVAVDFELANSTPDSVLEVGAVQFDNNRVVSDFHALVKYNGWFDPYATKVHGLRWQDVKRGLSASEAFESFVTAFPPHFLLVHHGGQEPGALRALARTAGRPDFDAKWLDTQRLAKLVWPEYRKGGANLQELADRLGISFSHHRAKEDARVCGLVLLAMLKLKPDLVSVALK